MSRSRGTTPSTSFFDVPPPEFEMDQREPVHADPRVQNLFDAVRNAAERAVMAKKNAEMAAHVATTASTAAIAKSQQGARDLQQFLEARRGAAGSGPSAENSDDSGDVVERLLQDQRQQHIQWLKRRIREQIATLEAGRGQVGADNGNGEVARAASAAHSNAKQEASSFLSCPPSGDRTTVYADSSREQRISRSARPPITSFHTPQPWWEDPQTPRDPTERAMQAIVDQLKLNVRRATMAANHAQKVSYHATQAAGFVVGHAAELKQAWKQLDEGTGASLSGGGASTATDPSDNGAALALER